MITSAEGTGTSAGLPRKGVVCVVVGINGSTAYPIERRLEANAGILGTLRSHDLATEVICTKRATGTSGRYLSHQTMTGHSPGPFELEM